MSYFSVVKNKTPLTKTEVDAQLELCWPEYPNHPIHVLYTNKQLRDIKALLTQADDEEKLKIIDEDSYIINGSHYVTKDSLYTIDKAKKRKPSTTHHLKSNDS